MKLFGRQNDDDSGLSRIFEVEHIISTSTHDVTLLTYIYIHMSVVGLICHPTWTYGV